MRLLLLWILLLALPALADTIYLKDDRVLVGKAKQDGDYWVIKTKIGSVRIHKDEVLRVEEGPGEAGPDPKGEEPSGEGGEFASESEGFSFHVRGKGWRIEQTPPRPMVYAMAVNDSLGVEMSVARLKDEEPSVPLAEDAAKSLQPAVEALLAVPTLELENVAMEEYPRPTGTAFLFTADGKRRLTSTDLVLRTVVLKAGGFVWFLQYEAPVGVPSEAEAAFEELVGSFQGGTEIAGGAAKRDVFTSGTLAFSIQRPEGWLLEGNDGDMEASASLSARDGTAEATLDVHDLGSETDLRTACKALAERLAGELASFEAGREEAQTVERRPARLFGFKYRRDGSPRGGVALVTREGTRVFEIVVRAAVESSARESLVTVMSGFKVLGADAAVALKGEAFDAMKALRDGDEQYAGGEYKMAQALYRKAIRAWPKFAHATLMLGRASFVREEMEEAVASAELANKLLPRREGVANLLACCYARQAKVLASTGEYKKAADWLCKAGALKVREDDLLWEVSEAAAAFTGDVRAEKYDELFAALKKAHAALPDSNELTEATTMVCRWIVSREIEAGDNAKALQVANEGLKIKPKDPGIVELMEQIQATEK